MNRQQASLSAIMAIIGGGMFNQPSEFIQFDDIMHYPKLPDVAEMPKSKSKLMPGRGNRRKDLEEARSGARRINKKMSRNAPCPCGSGVKYKLCCINR